MSSLKNQGNEIDISGYRSIVDVFDEACSRYSQLPAYSNLGATYTFSQVSQEVDHLASYWVHHTSLKAGDRIAIQLPNVIQYPVVFFAALKAGLVIVNTNPLYTEGEMLHQFNDAGVKGIVILANMAHKLEAILPETQIQTVVVTELADCHSFAKRHLINRVVKHVKRMVPRFHIPSSVSYVMALKLGRKQKFEQTVNFEPDNLALLQYTGGTTGVAKGAMLSHKNLLSNMLQVGVLLEKHTEDGKEVAIAPLPFYHIYSLTVNCLLMMHIGCHVVLITNPRDIPGFIKELRKWRFTIFSGLNTLFAALCRNSRFTQIRFDDLKLTISGGMALTEAVAKQWREVTGCEVLEGYGLTETSPVVAVNVPGENRLGTIGRAVRGTEVCLLDDDGNTVVDSCGELCIRGPQVMQGYWRRQADTENVFSEGWLRTGDIAELDPDGYIRIVDRKKDLIIVSGFNVYPNELEQVACSHPDIIESAAVGIPDPQFGEKVKLFVISKNPDLAANDVKTFIRSHLTNYKVPRLVEFCDDLPKSPVGKVLRRKLRD